MSVNEIDAAAGTVEAEAAPKYRVKGGSISASELEQHGLAMTEEKPSGDFNDDSIVNILYHRYDGRKIIVPSYMTPKILAFRVRDEAGIPREYVGQRAWHTTPQETPSPGEYTCFLHEDAPEDVKQEVIAAGLKPGRCRKRGMQTAYDAEHHGELKHKREARILRDRRSKKENEDWRNTSHAQAEALIRMAEAMSEGQKLEPKRGRPPKGNEGE